MRWFVAKLCFQIITGSEAAQFDEQFRLISAGAEAEAFARAQQLGAEEEESFLNVRREPVQWKWLGVTGLHEVGELRHGAELYSSIAEPEASQPYLQQVSLRSRMFEDRFAAAAPAALPPSRS